MQAPVPGHQSRQETETAAAAAVVLVHPEVPVTLPVHRPCSGAGVAPVPAVVVAAVVVLVHLEVSVAVPVHRPG